MSGENKTEKYQENTESENQESLEVQNGAEKVIETEKKRKPYALLLDIVVYALIIYTCLYLIPTYVIQRTIVDGPSMEDTLHNGDHLMVEKISYHLDQLKRFDIIVFYPHGRDNKEYYVKRIIGMPGETIQIKGKDIYINGEVLKEDYGKEPITFAGIAEEPLSLGKDEYFVMGDNREVSLDSRYEEVGVVPRKNIGGRAILRIWPLKKFGLIKN
ncbi:signal peptidase I [Anaerocolumna sp. AGMB13025]|uniref:signal peptidase I n=1 Tax=Anaerocolumna sp. AGMB13025 TaxID=3039116 RepID=UPI00241C27BC|nr:signal peptidase I [Anaerocolumna sp. AGMB13025]WFR55022.1 signal peptidase I [Anaerocolumna sp. AGMB13025]